MTAADLHPDTREVRPSSCCGVCPPIAGGGWDCTCPGNPRCSVSAPAAEWDDLARLAMAATPGEWTTYAAYGSRGVEVADTEDMLFIQDGGVTYAVNEADAEFIAAANPATILHLITELRRAKRAAQTLGRVIEQQGRDVLDATGMHHVIGEDGDGDWAVVWEVLADQAVERRQLAARLAAVEALADEWDEKAAVLSRQSESRAGLSDADQLAAVSEFYAARSANLRAVLSAAPTDTTKEN